MKNTILKNSNDCIHLPAHPEKGIVVEPLKSGKKSFIPLEAVKNSMALEKQGSTKRNPDPYSDERMDKTHPPVDSSEETLGG